MNKNREELGKFVRQVWIDYCQETGDTKSSHVAPWSALSEWDKEADRRIGEAVWDEAAAERDELLAACAALWQACVDADTNGDLAGNIDGALLDAARAAIAKARGQG